MVDKSGQQNIKMTEASTQYFNGTDSRVSARVKNQSMHSHLQSDFIESFGLDLDGFLTQVSYLP